MVTITEGPGEFSPPADAGGFVYLDKYRITFGPPVILGPPPTDADGVPISPFIELTSPDGGGGFLLPADAPPELVEAARTLLDDADAPHVVEGE